MPIDDKQFAATIRAILRFAAVTFAEVQALRLILTHVVSPDEINQARGRVFDSLKPFLENLDRADSEQINSILREFEGTVQ